MGRNFIDLFPFDDFPAIAETGGNLVGTSVTSKFQTTTLFPRASSGVVDVYEEYVPRPVPRGPRSVSKRGRADGSSSVLPASKKSRQSSTPPGIQVIGSMLLGEHIDLFRLFVVCLYL